MSKFIFLRKSKTFIFKFQIILFESFQNSNKKFEIHFLFFFQLLAQNSLITHSFFSFNFPTAACPFGPLAQQAQPCVLLPWDNRISSTSTTKRAAPPPLVVAPCVLQWSPQQGTRPPRCPLLFPSLN
jgi:hypothetical protein